MKGNNQDTHWREQTRHNLPMVVSDFSRTSGPIDSRTPGPVVPVETSVPGAGVKVTLLAYPIRRPPRTTFRPGISGWRAVMLTVPAGG
jgi:hypothetical protein